MTIFVKEWDGDVDDDDDDDNAVPLKGPSAEDENILRKIRELESKVDNNLYDLLGNNKQVIPEDLDDAQLDALLNSGLLGNNKPDIPVDLDDAQIDAVLKILISDSNVPSTDA